MGKLCPHPVLGDARERLQMDREGGEKGSPRHSRTQSGGQTGRARVGKVPAVSRESPSSALPRPEQPQLGSTRNKHTCSLQARGEAAPRSPKPCMTHAAHPKSSHCSKKPRPCSFLARPLGVHADATEMPHLRAGCEHRGVPASRARGRAPPVWGSLRGQGMWLPEPSSRHG